MGHIKNRIIVTRFVKTNYLFTKKYTWFGPIAIIGSNVVPLLESKINFSFNLLYLKILLRLD